MRLSESIGRHASGARLPIFSMLCRIYQQPMLLQDEHPPRCGEIARGERVKVKTTRDRLT